jgi:hypothetical protein
MEVPNESSEWKNEKREAVTPHPFKIDPTDQKK